MSENTLNVALRRLGCDKNTMTAHGFRSMASTILDEQQWHKDAIERQLAHGGRNKVRGSYNFAEHLPERRRMMQVWADYDGLRTGASKLLPLKRAGWHRRTFSPPTQRTEGAKWLCGRSHEREPRSAGRNSQGRRSSRKPFTCFTPSGRRHARHYRGTSPCPLDGGQATAHSGRGSRANVGSLHESDTATRKPPGQ